MNVQNNSSQDVEYHTISRRSLSCTPSFRHVRAHSELEADAKRSKSEPKPNHRKIDFFERPRTSIALAESGVQTCDFGSEIGRVHEARTQATTGSIQPQGISLRSRDRPPSLGGLFLRSHLGSIARRRPRAEPERSQARSGAARQEGCLRSVRRKCNSVHADASIHSPNASRPADKHDFFPIRQGRRSGLDEGPHHQPSGSSKDSP